MQVLKRIKDKTESQLIKKWLEPSDYAQEKLEPQIKKGFARNPKININDNQYVYTLKNV